MSIIKKKKREKKGGIEDKGNEEREKVKIQGRKTAREFVASPGYTISSRAT